MDIKPHEGEQTRHNRPGCFFLCITALLAGVGVIWLLTGSIDISYKDIHLKGLHARGLALIWIMFWLFPIITSCRKK